MNTFGQGYVAGSSAEALFPIYDVRNVLLSRDRFRREAMRDLKRANSFANPTGRKPARGFILMLRKDYNKLSKYSTTLQLDIGDTSNSLNVGALKNLAIVKAQCATRGLEADENALYVVEITDRRGCLCNKWFKFPTLTQYNIRTPAYPQTFYPLSMNSGTTWTWSTMLQNLWEQMGTFLGDWPGLPTTPAGTPEGFWMTGVSAWDQLNDILDHLGMQVCADLTKPAASQYTIKLKGGDDSAFEALTTKYANNLEDDREWIDYGAGRVPVAVTVYFKRRNAFYGSEETVRYDSLQWTMNVAYSVSINTGYTEALGTHHIWSDFTVRHDQDGQPLSEDVSTAQSIAQDVVNRYLLRIGVGARMTKVYAGALPFLTGTEVNNVKWYQDANGGPYNGWKTKVVRKPDEI